MDLVNEYQSLLIKQYLNQTTMKPNPYHFFAAATTSAILIAIGLILFGCTEPDPIIPDGIRCVSQSDTLQTDYTVTVVFGDSVRPNGLIVPIRTFEYTSFGQLQREMPLPDTVGLCQIIATQNGQFVPCRFTIINGGRLVKDVCCNGCTLAFELN